MSMANLVDLAEAPQSVDDVLDSYVDEIMGEAPEEVSDTDEIEAANEEEGEGEPEAEVEEEKTEEETPEYITIRANGKDVELTYDEVIEHAQKGLDYYKKTTELAEQRKTFETQAQQEKQEIQLRSDLINEISELKSIDSQLLQYSQVNWDAYQDQDPIEAIKAYRRYQELQNSRQQKVTEISNKQQHVNQQREAARLEASERGAAQVKEAIRSWTPERAQELIKTGVESYGFTSDEMVNLMRYVEDPRMVVVLNDAAKWRELQSKKPNIAKKAAEAPKIIKSGNTPKIDEKTERATAFKKMAQAKTKQTREKIADGLLDRFI
jgi:hypothetical protein